MEWPSGTKKWWRFSRSQALNHKLWGGQSDCFATLYQLHAGKCSPGNSELLHRPPPPPLSLCLELDRELALTLMKTYCFDMSVRAHCFALSLVVSNQARPVCNLKAPVKRKTFLPLIYVNSSNICQLTTAVLRTLLYLNEEMVYYLSVNAEQ